MYLNVVIMQSIWTKIVLSKYKYWQYRNYGGAVEELEVTLKLLAVRTVLSFFLFCIHSFSRSLLCHPVSVLSSDHVRIWSFQEAAEEEEEASDAKEDFEVNWFSAQIQIQTQIHPLGDRCPPWRHRRGRRLLNLSFILFLLPLLNPTSLVVTKI